MRLSELLEREAVDSNGAALGRVKDVRLVQDGPAGGAFGAALRIDGVVIGRSAIGVRLGFHRGRVRGPWPLKVLFGGLERRACFVPWDQLEIEDDGPIVVTGSPQEIPADTAQ
jgi:hypothetical protein